MGDERDDYTDDEREARAAIERKTCALGRMVAGRLPDGVGFALFLFDFGPGGVMSYVSNAERDDFAQALQCFLDKWKADLS
jgi:hypothetical protein